MFDRDVQDPTKEFDVVEKDAAYQLDSGSTGSIPRQEQWWEEGTTSEPPGKLSVQLYMRKSVHVMNSSFKLGL